MINVNAWTILVDKLLVTFNNFSANIYCCLVAKSCLILCGPMDYSQPGSSVHGIFQARILEWVAIPFSSLPSIGIEPTSPAWQVNSLPLSHQGFSTHYFESTVEYLKTIMI